MVDAASARILYDRLDAASMLNLESIGEANDLEDNRHNILVVVISRRLKWRCATVDDLLL